MSDVERKQSIDWLKVREFVNTETFIWHGRVIDFDSFSQGFDSVVIEGGFIKFYAGETLIAQVAWTYAQTIETFAIIDDILNLKLSGDTLKQVSLEGFAAKLSQVEHDATLTGAGTIASPLGIAPALIDALKQTVYKITLPAGADITDRLAGVVTKPDGWTLQADGATGANLKITHNLTGRGIVTASVKATDLTGTRVLVPFRDAYSGILENDLSLTIEGLAKNDLPLTIALVFD